MDVDGETDSNHDTALTLACAGGHEDLVELLLSRGADIEHRDKKVTYTLYIYLVLLLLDDIILKKKRKLPHFVGNPREKSYVVIPSHDGEGLPTKTPWSLPHRLSWEMVVRPQQEARLQDRCPDRHGTDVRKIPDDGPSIWRAQRVLPLGWGRCRGLSFSIFY